MSTKRIVFIMPEIDIPSEVFLKRTMELLTPYLVGIGCDTPSGKFVSVGTCKLPLYQLEDWPLPLAIKVLRRMKLLSSRSRSKRLSTMVESLDANIVYINYVTYALKFQDMFDRYKGMLAVQCHGVDVSWNMRQHMSPHPPKYEPNYVQRVKQLAARENTVFIANSIETISRLRKINIPEHKIQLKYLGVPIPREPISFNPTNEVNILFLGRLVDCKGPDQVIRAFDLACSRGLRGHLTIAGEGTLRQECETLVEESTFRENITLKGAVNSPQVDRLMRKADIFTAHNQVGPSTSQVEALGVSILEAMSYGLPVITGKSGGVKETVCNGETGFLVEPGNIEEHSKAFLRLSKDLNLRKAMGLKGRNRAAQEFSMAKEKARLWEILQLD